PRAGTAPGRERHLGAPHRPRAAVGAHGRGLRPPAARPAGDGDPVTAATAPVASPPAVASNGRRWTWLWVLTVALAILPIVVAVVRAILDHWLPVGDDAYFVLRPRDVWTSHIPLLGTWTSASLSTGRDINNPGPLFFDALAVPVTVFGGAAG